MSNVNLNVLDAKGKLESFYVVWKSLIVALKIWKNMNVYGIDLPREYKHLQMEKYVVS